jgi:hypothetical protein
LIQYAVTWTLDYFKEPRKFLVYNLKNTNNPIVRFENQEFHTIDFSFAIDINDNKTVFVFISNGSWESSGNSYYQIIYNKN